MPHRDATTTVTAGNPRRAWSTRAAAGATAGLVAVALAVSASPGSPAAAATQSRPVKAQSVLPTTTRVTLVTGDVALVTTRPGGKRTVALEPNADGTLPQAAITDTGTHLYVVPRAAVPAARGQAPRPGPVRRGRA